MSIKVMSRVWQESNQGSSPLLLLLAISDNANDNGFAWPGQETLAKKIRMSAKSIPRIARKLMDDGELFIHNRSNQGRVTQYVVTVGMDVDTFEMTLKTNLKFKPAQIEKALKWFNNRGGQIVPPPNCTPPIAVRGGVPIAVRGGVPIAVSTEPSLTINETSINPQEFSQTEKTALNRLAPFVAEQIDNENRPAADMPTKDELRQMVLLGYRLSKELCPLSIPGASRASLEALARATLLIWNKPDNEEKFRSWWYNEYWIGQKGQPPTPAQVGDVWGQFEAEKKPMKQNNPNLTPEQFARYKELVAQNNQQIPTK